MNKNLSRTLYYLQKPESDDSGEMLEEMRGERACRRYYVGWSDWSFLDVAKQQVAVLNDLLLLHRMGFQD